MTLHTSLICTLLVAEIIARLVDHVYHGNWTTYVSEASGKLMFVTISGRN